MGKRVAGASEKKRNYPQQIVFTWLGRVEQEFVSGCGRFRRFILGRESERMSSSLIISEMLPWSAGRFDLRSH